MDHLHLWLNYQLVLLLTGAACAFEVDRPLTIYMDVRKPLDDSVQIGKSCERKMSVMDSSILEMGKETEPNLQKYSFEELDNLERRVKACGLKLEGMQTMTQSLISRSREAMGELREQISKVLSTVSVLASNMERS